MSCIFTRDELDIMGDYVKEMLFLFDEDDFFYNSTCDIKFDLNTFLSLKYKIEALK